MLVSTHICLNNQPRCIDVLLGDQCEVRCIITAVITSCLGELQVHLLHICDCCGLYQPQLGYMLLIVKHTSRHILKPVKRCLDIKIATNFIPIAKSETEFISDSVVVLSMKDAPKQYGCQYNAMEYKMIIPKHTKSNLPKPISCCL